MKRVDVMGRIVMAAMMLGLCLTPVWAQESAEQHEEQLLTFIKEANPSMAKHIEKVRSINLEEYRKLLQDVANQYREIRQLEIAQPDLAKKVLEGIKLEGQIGELAERYRQTSDTKEKENVRAEMKAMLTQAFDNKVVLQEARISTIEKELQQMKSRIAKKRENKDKLIEKRISELTAEEYLQWE